VSKGTANNVVLKGGKPMYVSDNLEWAQEVARKLQDEWDEDVDLWKNVTFEIEAANAGESDQ